uniref:Ig-like domain-containing protein n=1 Tax=Chelonoidis abingdonii TaxID=106734 RepID=A0A8C0GYJ0_CHEAB
MTVPSPHYFGGFLSGLVPIMAEVETTVFGAVGEQVILPCIDKSQSDGVTWKYNELVVIHLFILPKGRSPLTSRSELNKQEMAKGNFSLILSQLEHSDAGKYVCVVGSRTFKVQLQVFEVTGSPSDYLLQGENLTLSIQGSSSVSVTWSNNRKDKVTATQSRELKNGGRTLQIHNLQVEDSGTWRCHITSLSAKLDIPYKVLVIGKRSMDLSLRTLQMPRKCKRRWINLNISHLLLTHKPRERSRSITWIPSSQCPDNPLEVKLPKVQFEDAGWYQCQLTVSRGRVEKAIYLVVMTVSADPVGPLSKWANMTLLCKLSAPIPPNAQLFWEHVNGTEKKLNMLGHSEVMVKTKTVGLWRCSLKVENNMMTSIDYTVVKAAEWNIYVLIGAVVGASIVLLLLASLFIFICTARQRRRVSSQVPADSKGGKSLHCTQDESWRIPPFREASGRELGTTTPEERTLKIAISQAWSTLHV